ncbi:Predicted arabinose efflux permease, MFS family [Leifsonia sp. 98AMF]|uniref:MFS transporter n=1 Tax=unclassified Leifsonia TaxID=2663824 RepID=UPI000879B22B|nr:MULTISPECIES: MFS transporter [unclassified Leifsonia]SDH71761.1 Predicted arabinose efflux permease, MFS family [Leifsonia sp. 197AMF]SDJ50256.1 Predicted arabinose efflux permease, MFS family [Leifsonia sp. 466MF]SDK24184.1 Predicted arabinose efflux permease, MFS family [Leifsonia sp. 157MF]SDN70143.1 Predicted arabinose efflux permease, MFS family [Leifsonia sp. 509MF]SEN38071.1 Predicted arabinose efflux permease, MFS family [Leifsonia sp. 467MF]
MTASPASIASSSTARTRTPLLLGLGLALFASVSTELLPPALILGMSSTLGVDASAVGALVAVWAVTIVIGTVPAMQVTRHVPRKPLLVVSLAVLAVATVVVAVVPVFAVVVVARLVSALAAAVSWSVVFAYVPMLTPPERLGRAMAIVLGGGTLASVLGVPAGAALAAAGAWQWAFLGAAGLVIVSALVLAMGLPRLPGAATGGARTRSLDRSAIPVAALLSAGALLLTGYMTLYAYIVPVLGAARIGPDGVGTVLLMAGLAGAVALLLGGALSDRYPATALLALVAAVPAGILLITIAPASGLPQPLAAAGTALVGFGIGGLPPVLQARVARTASATFRPTATGLFVVVLNIGIAAGSAMGGVLIATSGRGSVAPVALLLAGAAVVAFAALVARPAHGRTFP